MSKYNYESKTLSKSQFFGVFLKLRMFLAKLGLDSNMLWELLIKHDLV